VINAPFNEVEVLNKTARDDLPVKGDEDRIVYLLRVKAVGIRAAKGKAMAWTRFNNPFGRPSEIKIIQVLDPSSGGVLEGSVPGSIKVDEDDQPDIDGIVMRDTFDVQVGVTE